MVQSSERFYWKGWKSVFKRCFDIVISLFFLLILSPVYLLISFIVLVTAGAPVFYTQERVGKNNRIFKIIKFRTMKHNAEIDGPMLALENDERIVGFGKMMRKWRIDELPQFINVLLGDMSIVGPRPERLSFVEELKKRNSNYEILFNVKPGITSMGMVKYGYASTIEEMLERFQFDYEYMQHLSLKQDVQILFNTITVLFEGSGK